MDLNKLEDDVQAALTHLEEWRNSVVCTRPADMYDQLDLIYEATDVLMRIANDYGLDVFTTLPYDG